MSALSNTESQVPSNSCCKSVSSLPLPSMPVPHTTGTRLCHEPLLILALDVFSLPSPSMPGMHVAWTRVEHDDCSFWHLGYVYSCTCTDFACLCVECCIPLMHTSHSCAIAHDTLRRRCCLWYTDYQHCENGEPSIMLQVVFCVKGALAERHGDAKSHPCIGSDA